MVEVVEVGPAEGDKVVEGEVVRDGEDKEESGGGGLGWEGGTGRGSEQVECASAFAKFRVVGLGMGSEDGLGIERVVGVH